MRILFLTPYPHGTAPGQRFRYEQYLDLLTAQGHEYYLSSFLSRSVWAVLYQPGHTVAKVLGVLAGFGRRVADLFRAPGYDFVFVFREASPLGPPVFDPDSGALNEAVGLPALRQYLWYSETRQPLPPAAAPADNAAFLGQYEGAAYYFHYQPDALTTLNHEFLSTVRTPASQYIVYADNCLLTPEFLTQRRLVFKKIPRDVTRF